MLPFGKTFFISLYALKPDFLRIWLRNKKASFVLKEAFMFWPKGLLPYASVS
jgi:hypothetical protein